MASAPSICLWFGKRRCRSHWISVLINFVWSKRPAWHHNQRLGEVFDRHTARSGQNYHWEW